MTGLKERCPGCGAVFAAREGPTHRYMISSPACWAHYGELLAAEYSNDALMPVHRLSVDVYAVQHPGDGSRQAIQSVGLHLARLMNFLETPMPPDEANEVMLRLGPIKSNLHLINPPDKFAMTIADVVPYIGTTRHTEMVRSWAQSAWSDWHRHHDYIRAWANSA